MKLDHIDISWFGTQEVFTNCVNENVCIQWNVFWNWPSWILEVSDAQIDEYSNTIDNDPEHIHIDEIQNVTRIWSIVFA